MRKVFSIIIPVYNSEKYLVKCLDSVTEQTFADFEVLLINDGSTDSSGKICDEYAAKDSRFKVFHKENGGVSSARNLGIEVAKGEWIWFVDADDYIRQDAIETISKELKKSDIDGVLFGYQKKIDNKLVVYDFPEKGEVKFLGKTEVLKSLYQSVYYPYQGYVWSKIFKSEIINQHKLRFDENIYFNEDRLFCFAYFVGCNGKTAYILADLYTYADSPESAMSQLTRQYNPKFETDIDAYLAMQEMVKKEKLHSLEKYARFGNLFAAKRLLEMRRKFSVPPNELEQKLKKLMKENFNFTDYIGRKARMGYLYWKYIQSI